MGVNIGTDAVKALENLRNQPDVENLLVALGAWTQARMVAAMSTAPDVRVDATGHARGMHELWAAMYSAWSGTPLVQVKPEPPVKRRINDTQLGGTA